MPKIRSMNDKSTLTYWMDPAKRRPSGYALGGLLSNRAWCCYEIDWHERKGRAVDLVEREDGRIALTLARRAV